MPLPLGLVPLPLGLVPLDPWERSVVRVSVVLLASLELRFDVKDAKSTSSPSCCLWLDLSRKGFSILVTDFFVGEADRLGGGDKLIVMLGYGGGTTGELGLVVS